MTGPIGLVGKGFGCRWGRLSPELMGQTWAGEDRREGTPGSMSNGMEVGANGMFLEQPAWRSFCTRSENQRFLHGRVAFQRDSPGSLVGAGLAGMATVPRREATGAEEG